MLLTWRLTPVAMRSGVEEKNLGGGSAGKSSGYLMLVAVFGIVGLLGVMLTWHGEVT